MCGIYSAGVISQLGLLSEGQPAWKAQDITIQLPSQPKKSILKDDQAIRHYTHFDLEEKTNIQFVYDGEIVEKQVYFRGFESAKTITASSRPSYAIYLRIQLENGGHYSFQKHYYSCH